MGRQLQASIYSNGPTVTLAPPLRNPHMVVVLHALHAIGTCCRQTMHQLLLYIESVSSCCASYIQQYCPSIYAHTYTDHPSPEVCTEGMCMCRADMLCVYIFKVFWIHCMSICRLHTDWFKYRVKSHTCACAAFLCQVCGINNMYIVN